MIHSFWVPNLGGKRDLIPGQATSIWFQADTPGVYRGQCAEFCGHPAREDGHSWWSPSRRRSSRPGWSAQRDSARTPADSLTRRGRGAGVPRQQLRDVPRHRAARRPGAGVGPDLTHFGEPPHHRRRHAAEHARAPGGLDHRPAARSSRALRMPPNALERRRAAGAARLPGEPPVSDRRPTPDRSEPPRRTAPVDERSRAGARRGPTRRGLVGLAHDASTTSRSAGATSSRRSSSSSWAGSRRRLMRLAARAAGERAARPGRRTTSSSPCTAPR